MHKEGYIYESPPTVEEAYHKCKHLIESTTRGFASKHGLDYEDALAQANLIFVRAYQTYDPKRGPLGARVCHEVWTYLFDYMRSQRCRNSRLQFRDPIIMDVTNKLKRRFDLNSFLDCLSADAQEVVSLVLNPSEKEKGSRGPARKTKTLVQELLYRGWSGRRIAEVFKEISQNLS